MKRLLFAAAAASLLAACASTTTQPAGVTAAGAPAAAPSPVAATASPAAATPLAAAGALPQVDLAAAQRAAAERAAAERAAAQRAAADQAGKAAPTALAPVIASAAPAAAVATGNGKSQPALATLYFDFDQSTIRDEFKTALEGHAAYLQDNPSRNIAIEGHADERGSREYNIGLGQRRADAVKRLLTVLGVADKQIETISYGEEKPLQTGHDEASWAKNRRAEILYRK